MLLEWALLDDVHQLELIEGKMIGEYGKNILGTIIEGKFVFCLKSHLGLWSCNIMILDEKDE